MRIGVAVAGVAEIQRALRTVDRQLPRELREAGNKAARLVEADARARANRLGPGPRRAAATLRAASQQRVAALKLGNKATPDALGWEYGAYRSNPRRRRGPGSSRSYVGFRQFMPWRGNDADAGYFVWPAIRARLPEAADIYLNEVDKLLARAGLK